MALEAEGIAGLGGRGAVIAPAVGLDDEAEVGPEEVDLELVDELLGERSRQAGRCGDRAEEKFQLVVGEPERVLVEDLAKETDAWLSRVVVEGAPKPLRVDHVELVSVIDRALYGLRPCDGRKVDEGANWLGKGNAQAGGDVFSR